ncbi:MAG TPA: FAD-dependent thymidylate synthase [Sulfolobales archaeon]|nr:FAD-dependent thymidylate synthase [Sulfolobales archaeon]
MGKKVTMIPTVRIISYTQDGEKLVAASSKRSLSSKDVSEIFERMDDEEVEVWIRETLRRGHLSPWEHSIYTFEVICSRVCSHQLVRHRIASYTQLSQRYNERLLEPRETKYWLEISERVLSGDKEAFAEVGRVFYLGDPDWPEDLRIRMASEYARSVAKYWELRGKGLSREDARYILPQAVATKIVVTMNAREILHLLGLRMCTHAQTEIRIVAWKLRNELVKIHPRLFKYAGPYCLLDNNLVSKEPLSLEDIVEGRAAVSIDRCRELVPREGIRNCILSSLKLYLSAL